MLDHERRIALSSVALMAVNWRVFCPCAIDATRHDRITASVPCVVFIGSVFHFPKFPSQTTPAGDAREILAYVGEISPPLNTLCQREKSMMRSTIFALPKQNLLQGVAAH